MWQTCGYPKDKHICSKHVALATFNRNQIILDFVLVDTCWNTTPRQFIRIIFNLVSKMLLMLTCEGIFLYLARQWNNDTMNLYVSPGKTHKFSMWCLIQLKFHRLLVMMISTCPKWHPGRAPSFGNRKSVLSYFLSISAILLLNGSSASCQTSCMWSHGSADFTFWRDFWYVEKWGQDEVFQVASLLVIKLSMNEKLGGWSTRA